MISYTYDTYGWYAGVSKEETARSTPVAPPDEEHKWNWNGGDWISFPLDYVIHAPAHVGETAPVEDPAAWLIDIGSLYDRLGAEKPSILASTDAEVLVILRDISVRQWLDLRRPEVAYALGVLVEKGLISEENKSEILETPVAPYENMALRKLYFS